MCRIEDMSGKTDILNRLGSELRERRRSAGLSQNAAASAAGVGRSTLIHLEQGNTNVSLSNALAIARVVGATVAIQGESADHAERRRLRSEEALKLARRREAHLALSVDLALDRPGANRALADARKMVEIWKRDRTCSALYIDGWSRVLKGEAPKVAGRMRGIDPQWMDAMFQNTPFSRALALP